jgi:tRNA (guanosine-2'-O-)-methyltransferase
MTENRSKSNLRQRVDKIKFLRCKNLVVVIEEPNDLANIGSVIRNVNALGAEKVYIIDSNKLLPDDWGSMRGERILSRTSASAVKWTFVKRFDDTASCINHLRKKEFTSVVTSPHVKGKRNIELSEAKFTQSKLAIWFGNEVLGISDEAVESSEFCVSITMSGIIESLNLATSTGIVLYEATKQRRAFALKKLKVLKQPS